jgi:hypothetical protein
MGEDLEDKVNKRQITLSFKDIKWIVAIVISVIGWGITAYLWVADKSKMKEEIITLQTENKSLSEKVIKLEGQVEGVNNAAQIFMENSPSENRYRIEKLEHDVSILKQPGEASPEDFEPTMVIDTTNVIEREGPSTHLNVDNN